MKAEYLGDGVYVSFDGYQLWLAANEPNNRLVAIEPSVWEALNDYVRRLREELTKEQAGG